MCTLVDSEDIKTGIFGGFHRLRGMVSKLMKNSGHAQTEFHAGQTIFQQGDPGGDIYFIEDGIVEIFIERDGLLLVIGEMKKGEILGLMTFLNGERRLASARAKTAIKLKKVSRGQIHAFVHQVPRWFEIVLKEFTIRIAQMNRKYMDAMLELRSAKDAATNDVFVARQLASTMAILAESMKVSVDGIDFVILEDLKSKVFEALVFSKDRLDKILRIFFESGLLVLEVEKDRNRKAIRYEHLEQLALFNSFVQDAKHGATRKLVRTGLTSKEIRTLIAIVRMVAKREGVNPKQVQKIIVKDIAESLQKEMNVLFHEQALLRPISLGLIISEGDGDQRAISFTPAELGRIVASIDVIKKLSPLKAEDDVLSVTNAA